MTAVIIGVKPMMSTKKSKDNNFKKCQNKQMHKQADPTVTEYYSEKWFTVLSFF